MSIEILIINRRKAVHTFLDNMFRSVSRQVQYMDTARKILTQLSRNRSKHVVQNCVYRSVLVDSDFTTN